MEALRSSETSAHAGATRRNIPEDGNLHSRCRENLESYIATNRLSSVVETQLFSVRYELYSYISKDRILHSHRRENLKFYTAATGWAL
jgi:hypothetical protein